MNVPLDELNEMLDDCNDAIADLESFNEFHTAVADLESFRKDIQRAIDNHPNNN